MFEIILMEDKQNGAPIIKGKYFYAEGNGKSTRAIRKTLSQAQKYATKHNGFIAPMPLILEEFPHSLWVTAGTEDLVLPDLEGKFGKAGEPVVVTLHYGLEGIGLLTPEVLKKTPLNNVFAADLTKAYTNDQTAAFLQGNMPDNSKLLIMSYEQLLSEGTPKEFARYAVVRSLELARETDSGYKSIVSRLIDKQGNVKDSQIIVHSGKKELAQILIEGLLERNIVQLGVWHSFNLNYFNPKQPQGRFLYVDLDLVSGIGGGSRMCRDARFVVADYVLKVTKCDAPKIDESVSINSANYKP